MTTRSQYRIGTLTFYDDATFETVLPVTPLYFKDDFAGAGVVVPAAGTPSPGYSWVKKIVGAAPPTVAQVANGSGGQVALALTATSEKQDAALYFNDARCIDMTKSGHFEVRAALTVPPSAAGVQVVFGLAANWIDGPDNNAFYAEFGCTASNALLCRMQDGVSQRSAAAASSGVAVALDTAFHSFRISSINPTDVAFLVDGSRVNAPNSMSFAAVGANAVLQPYIAVYKPSGVGVATLTVDSAAVWQGR